MTKNTRFTLATLLLWFANSDIARAVDYDRLAAMPLDSLMQMPVVAASKHEQTPREAPASVTVITADEIRRYGWQTLDEVFQAVRGFYITDDLLNQYLGARGFSRPSDYNNRILMLVDGHSLNESDYGSAPIGTPFTLDLNAVKQIEIVRGPSSVLYGTGAMFAIINVVMDDPRQTGGSSAAFIGGTTGKRGFSLLRRSAPQSGLRYHVSARGQALSAEEFYFNQFDTPETHAGLANNVDREESYGLKAGVAGRQWNIDGYAMRHVKGMTVPFWGINFNDPEGKSEENWLGMNAELRRSFSKRVTLTGRAYGNHYYYKALYPYDPANFDEHAENAKLGAELRADMRASAAQRTMAGVELNNSFRLHSWSGYGGESLYSHSSFPYSDLAAYAQHEYKPRRNLVLTGGARFARYSFGPQQLSPRASLVWSARPTTHVKLLYGEAFRAPLPSEVEWTTYINATPLEAERVQTKELVLEQRLHRNLNLTASYFDNHIFDLIDPVWADDVNKTFANVGTATSDGVEGELQWKVRNGWNGFANYTYQYSTGNDGAELSNSPRHLAKLGLSHPVSKWATLAAEYRYESSRLTLIRTTTSPVSQVHLAATSSRLLKPVRLTMRVRNLFNQASALPGGEEHLMPNSTVDMPTIPQRKRAVTLTLGYDF